VSTFHCCKRFSENVTHASACLRYANGQAFLRGMPQAAFLKAKWKFLLMWESPTVSQANEKPESRIKCERKVSANCLSLGME